MDVFKVYIKAFDLNESRRKILEEGAAKLLSYLRDAILFANSNLNHNTHIDARCIYSPSPNHGDVNNKDVLLHITPYSFKRCYIVAGPDDGAAGITYPTSKGVFSEIFWSFIEDAGQHVGNSAARALANYGFHELVHNKAFAKFPALSDNDIFVHNQCGFGILKRNLIPQDAGGMAPSPENIRAMANLYMLPVEQHRLFLVRVPHTPCQK